MYLKRLKHAKEGEVFPKATAHVAHDELHGEVSLGAVAAASVDDVDEDSQEEEVCQISF